MHDSMKESCRRRTARIYGSVHDSTKESCRTGMCMIWHCKRIQCRLTETWRGRPRS